MNGTLARHSLRRLASGLLLALAGLIGTTAAVADDNFPPVVGGVPAMPVGWATSPGADAGWAPASDSANQGPNSLKSAPITDNQTAAVEVRGTFPAGTISFAYRVSSEAGFDTFNFYIDGVAQFPQPPDPAALSGEIPWTQASFLVSAGTHTLRWAYAKDVSGSFGADAAWIDTVQFPAGTTLQMLLNVTRVGVGTGTVTSSPAGINCGVTCSSYFSLGTPVTLTATPGPGWVFVGWSGPCTGTSTCPLTMDNAKSVTAAFALPDDNFPPGGQLPNGWATSPGAEGGWVVASDSPYKGPFTLKSANISDEESAAIEVFGNFAAGSVSFAYEVSSEQDFDFFRFYIDGVQQLAASGEVPWTQATFPVSAGPHTFQWLYAKDISVSAGADAAWIDNVVLPSGTLQMLLNVQRNGSGTGTVTSSPAGIDCGATCTEHLTTGSALTLTATPGAGTAFVHWMGDCSSTITTCPLTMTNSRSVVATFAAPDDNFPPAAQIPAGWTTDPLADAGWEVADHTANRGLYSLMSSAVTDLENAGIQVSGSYPAGNVSFAYRVSSEAGFDTFNFYIDDVAQFPDPAPSGEVPWTQASFPVSAGTHTFKWVYAKDGTNSAGQDRAWIDTVVLPATRAATSTAITAHTPNPSFVAAPIAVTASVTPSGGGTPTGTITVTDGTSACFIALPATSCNLTPSASGTKTLTATYSGDGAFNGSTSPGVSHTVNIVTSTLDVDASITATKYDALTDGLLIVRYMFGLTGTALTSGALGGTATRTDPAAIKAYLDGMGLALDIDGSGKVDALTDGLLIVRYLFGLRGSALIANAVDPAATRKTAPDIETYIQSLMP